MICRCIYIYIIWYYRSTELICSLHYVFFDFWLDLGTQIQSLGKKRNNCYIVSLVHGYMACMVCWQFQKFILFLRSISWVVHLFFISIYLVGGLVAIFYVPIYWVANHPNWRSYFSEGWPNHQPDGSFPPSWSLGISYLYPSIITYI